jgi:hypothetical protein
VILPGFLKPDHVQALREAVSAMKAKESGEADPLKHSGRVIGMFHKDQLLLDLFDDPRLHAIAMQLLGQPADLRFLGDEYVSYSTPADWHPDMGANEAFEALKFGFYLDDLSRGGCLRVVPGSHKPELQHAVGEFRKAEAGASAPEIDCAYSCITKPGDLLVFNLKLWHQGTANPPGTHRRVIFWSVGQNRGKFGEYARNFHDKVGRGPAEEAWPELILKGATPRRREMLDVYERTTRKGAVLAA